MTIVKSPKLKTDKEVNEWKENFEADDVKVEVIDNGDSTRTVQADYPEGDVPSFPTKSWPRRIIALPCHGLNQSHSTRPPSPTPPILRTTAK